MGYPQNYPYPPQQQYPPQQPYPQQQYPPQQPYPQQQYPPQQQQQQYPPQQPYPQQPTVHASIDDFYDQPAGGSGKSLASWFDTDGKSITGVVARPLTKADIQQQTDITTRQPLWFADGRPKLTMIVPLLVTPSPDFPEGRAAWYVRGDVRNELSRAMNEAGVTHQREPEAGAVITITRTGQRAIRNLNPAKVFRVTYQRPQGAAAGPARTAIHDQQPPNGYAAPPDGDYTAQQQPEQSPPWLPPQQPQYQPQHVQPQPQYQPQHVQPQYQPQHVQPQPQYQPQHVQPQYQQQAPQSPADGQAAAQPMTMPDNLTPEQQELIRQLTGNQ